MISFIEKTYKCSGLCKAPLFYLTQDITKGPPKSACLDAVIKDVGPLFNAIGEIMIASGIIFLFMLFCACPICCFNKEEYEAENVTEV